ncbi:MAG TPA: AAA family ATPase, partial [Aggregatilineales bacterium]|nr:AAA family ATPase [Aggregatilineales bacterium]
ISALAGTGKTSTLVWIAKRLPKAESKIFCAFNADIVKDLQSKLDGTGVTARTFHSLGLGALKKYLDVKELPPKDDKYRVLVNKWAEQDGVFSL